MTITRPLRRITYNVRKSVLLMEQFSWRTSSHIQITSTANALLPLARPQIDRHPPGEALACG